MMRGNLIVFEGVDGAGTTTQAAQLRKKFAEAGLPAHVTAQPSAGPVGSLIRQILTGRLVAIGGKTPGWATMSLLFAADRQDQQENEIEPNLREGVNVICDRYVHSSVIYQGLGSRREGAPDWVLEINKLMRKPDVVFFLRISPDDACRRRISRAGRPEIYDDARFQAELVDHYERLEELFPDQRFVTLDATRDVDDLAGEIWAVVEEIRALGAPE